VTKDLAVSDRRIAQVQARLRPSPFSIFATEHRKKPKAASFP